MPIRLVCPSCSAALSVKDEYAGRAVKCPKCGGVIPASQTGTAAPSPSKPSVPALPPPPPPEPAPAPFETVDDPEPPRRPGGRVIGKVTAKGEDRAADDEDAPPARRKGRDADDEPVAKKAKKRGDDADADRDDDRPARKKRRGDDDDGEGPGKKKGGSKTGLIIVVLLGGLLTCCGGGGYGVYYALNYAGKKAKEGVEDFADSLKPKNDKVTPANFQKLSPKMTKGEAESILGSSKPARILALNLALSADAPNNKARIAEWDPKIDDGRVLVWENKDDKLFVAFHDKPDAGGKLQMKMYISKGVIVENSGEPDDDTFLKANNLAKPTGAGGGTPGGAEIAVAAEDLTREFKDDKDAASSKYTGKSVVVDGKLKQVTGTGDNVEVVLIGFDDEAEVSATLAPATAKSVFALSLGQRVKLRGVCVGQPTKQVSVANGKIESNGPDPAVTATASMMVKDYIIEKNGDTKYKGKSVTIVGARVERVDNGELVVVPAKGIANKKIRVRLEKYLKDKFTNLKADAIIVVRGKCDGLDGMEVVIEDAYVVQP